MKIIISCEHGGNEIPAKYLPLFKSAESRLASHEGLDLGALKLAKAFSHLNCAYFCYSKISRLLVDLNRSPSHPNLFSSITKPLPAEQKREILERYYFPYRNDLIETIEKLLAQGESVFHLSVHSFTPVFKGTLRNADIGLLYDPGRKREMDVCHLWKNNINTLTDLYKVRYNYPYLGKADGLVTYLRKLFPPAKYMGVELEVNQFRLLNQMDFNRLKKILPTTFIKSIELI